MVFGPNTVCDPVYTHTPDRIIYDIRTGYDDRDDIALDGGARGRPNQCCTGASGLRRRLRLPSPYRHIIVKEVPQPPIVD